jgi:transcriptional regulator with XRE-family HTH domain
MKEPGEIDWRFKKAISDAGLTQRELGKLTGINHTHLSMYCHGRFNLNDEEKRKIAKALKMPESAVFGD